MNKSIAITGAEGFLGSKLVIRLKKEGYSLRIFDREIHNLFEPSSMKDLLKGVDVIIHLAGKNRGSDYEILKINSCGTLSLLEAAKTLCPHTLLIFSSSYQIYTHNNSYALSKIIAEKYIKHFIEQSNLRSAILRISNIYGPGCKPNYNSVIATFIHNIKHGLPIYINGDGEQKRDYIYVDDVVMALIQILKKKPEKKYIVRNIGSEEYVSINEIIGLLSEISNKNVKKHYNNDKKDFHKTIKILPDFKGKTSLTEGLRYAYDEK